MVGLRLFCTAINSAAEDPRAEEVTDPVVKSKPILTLYEISGDRLAARVQISNTTLDMKD
jgi:hypothetical protein